MASLNKTMLIVDLKYLGDCTAQCAIDLKAEDFVRKIGVHIANLSKHKWFSGIFGSKHLVYPDSFFDTNKSISLHMWSGFTIHKNECANTQCADCESIQAAKEECKLSADVVINLSEAIVTTLNVAGNRVADSIIVIVGSHTDYKCLLDLGKKNGAAVFIIGIEREECTSDEFINIMELLAPSEFFKYGISIQSINERADKSSFEEFVTSNTSNSIRTQWTHEEKNLGYVLTVFYQTEDDAIKAKEHVRFSMRVA